MHSALLARKELLAVLTEIQLPALLENAPLDILVTQIGMKSSNLCTVRELTGPPLLLKDCIYDYPHGRRWMEAEMVDTNCPCLCCVVEGEADLQVGVTDAMLATFGAGKSCGGYDVSMKATSYMLFPAGVPYSSGAVTPWRRDTPHDGKARIVKFRFLPVGTLCHISTLRNGKYEVGYSLFVDDSRHLAAIELLGDELRRQPTDIRIIRAQLSVILLRLHRSLLSEVPAMTDGLRSRFPAGESDEFPGLQPSNSVVQKVHDYIKLHLHEHLTAGSIARQVSMSPTQLNRILRLHAGTSVMGYLTRQRVEVAKLLLQSSDLPVSEISSLVGFKQLPHFSRTFHSHTGRSPLNYRQIAGNPSMGMLQLSDRDAWPDVSN